MHLRLLAFAAGTRVEALEYWSQQAHRIHPTFYTTGNDRERCSLWSLHTFGTKWRTTLSAKSEQQNIHATSYRSTKVTTKASLFSVSCALKSIWLRKYQRCTRHATRHLARMALRYNHHRCSSSIIGGELQISLLGDRLAVGRWPWLASLYYIIVSWSIRYT